MRLRMLQDHEQTQASTILAVEDDPDVGALLLQAISLETSHQLLLVTDSVQAIQVAQEVIPILFILNYHLPHMNGIELYDRLHAMEALAHVPAIMVSAAPPKHELAHRQIVVINKPFDLSKLLETIDQLTA